jgi:hypothetical protein
MRKPTKRGDAAAAAKLVFRGQEVKLPVTEKWQRFTLQAKQGKLTSVGEEFSAPIGVSLSQPKSAIGLGGSTAAVEFANIYVRDL